MNKITMHEVIVTDIQADTPDRPTVVRGDW